MVKPEAPGGPSPSRGSTPRWWQVRKTRTLLRELRSRGEQSDLPGELGKLISDAQHGDSKAQFWARFWQVTDVVLGLAAAVLAAIAGAAGLATATNRVTAAILALTAAGLAAANQFLRSGDRYERNRTRRNAWQALERDARLERANEYDDSLLYQVMRELLRRRVAIMDMDHRPVAPSALGSPKGSSAPGDHPRPAPG